MEECLNSRDGLASKETVRDCEGKKGSDLDHDFSLVECGFDECKNRLRGLFNDVLVNFLREKSFSKCVSPLPVLCANGQHVDLFKLFWVVRKLGGYNSISRKSLWNFVAEECGLGFGAIASVKLIYIKYLNELDHWLWQGYRDSSFEHRVVKNLDELVTELGKVGRDLMEVRRKGKNEDVISESDESGKESNYSKRLVHCSYSRNTNEVHDSRGECVDDHEKFYLENENDLVLSAKQVIQKVIKEVNGISRRKTYNGDNKICSRNENGVTASAKKVIEKAIVKVHDATVDAADVDEQKNVPDYGDVMLPAGIVDDTVVDSRKRKRESSSLSAMLSWVKNTAKHPDDLAIGILPECSKWKHHGNQELWFQVLLAREALLIKRHANLNAESSVQQKKFRMHPSMYEDDVLNNQSVETSRCSQRLPLAKSQSCSCCKSPPQSKVVIPQKTEARCSAKESSLSNIEISDTNELDHITMDEPEREVCVGPQFQAEVPEWTGVIIDSDDKWLGKQMWPLEDVNNEPVFELDPIGKGRPNTCDCSFPGNVECIRFHIAEKRLKLKREIRGLFYKWRFDHMGEEVSLFWTAEQEKKFKKMIMSNTATTNKFWRNAFRIFPAKTRETLVSYYFNVFLVRRRSYQNRVTPKDVDSDDDETEFGSVGDSFGYRAIYVPESRLPACFENKQCVELE